MGEKPTVIPYNYINRHAGTPNTTITKGTISLDTAQFVTLGLGSIDRVGVDEGNLQVIDVEVIIENCPLVFLYGTYLPVAIMVSVIHKVCLKKNLNSSRPSEHPPVRGKNVKN